VLSALVGFQSKLWVCTEKQTASLQGKKK